MLLEVNDIDVFYGQMQVLWGVSIAVGEGKIVALVGPNGAGKSTLLKAICGVIKVRKGEIKFAGESIKHLHPEDIVRRGVCLVPEGRKVFTKLTVLENLKLGSCAQGYSEKTFKEHLDNVLSLFPVLRGKINVKAGSLSGGEQQMLAIARALMARPKLLVMDEPSLGLSPLLVKSIFDLTLALKEQGITILLLEQNVRQALNVCDYAYVLKHGKVVLEGAPTNLLQSVEIREVYLGRIGS